MKKSIPLFIAAGAVAFMATPRFASSQLFQSTPADIIDSLSERPAPQPIKNAVAVQTDSANALVEKISAKAGGFQCHAEWRRSHGPVDGGWGPVAGTREQAARLAKAKCDRAAGGPLSVCTVDICTPY